MAMVTVSTCSDPRPVSRRRKKRKQRDKVLDSIIGNVELVYYFTVGVVLNKIDYNGI